MFITRDKVDLLTIETRRFHTPHLDIIGETKLVRSTSSWKRKPESLRESLLVELNKGHEVRITAIDEEDFSGVIRKTKEFVGEKPEDYFERGILSLKQYYAVALLDPLNKHAVSDAIDPFWHSHILHTKQYARFCENVAGQFIHHEPLDHGDPKAVKEVAELYAYTQKMYSKMFKHIDREFFPGVMPEARLICFHYRITNPDIEQIALFEKRG